jgi:hypothetical protein
MNVSYLLVCCFHNSFAKVQKNFETTKSSGVYKWNILKCHFATMPLCHIKDIGICKAVVEGGERQDACKL